MTEHDPSLTEVFIELRLIATVGCRQVAMRACDRVRRIDGLAAERFTFADPIPLALAVMQTPRLWWRTLRWQLADALAVRRSA